MEQPIRQSSNFSIEVGRSIPSSSSTQAEESSPLLSEASPVPDVFSKLGDANAVISFYQQQLAARDARITSLLLQQTQNQATLALKIDECHRIHEASQKTRLELEKTNTSLAQLQLKYDQAVQAFNVNQTELNAKTENNAWLSRMLKKAQEDSRALSSDQQLLKEQVRALSLELDEAKAKYGLLGQEAVIQVIQKQEEAVLENAELQQRLIARNLQFQELSDMLSEAKRELDPALLQLEKLTAENKTLSDENRLLKTQVVSLQSAARELRAKNKPMKVELQAALGSVSFLTSEKLTTDTQYQNAQAELTQMSERFEALTSEKNLLVDTIKLAITREDLLKADLQVAREEKKAKDKQIRELRDNLSYLNEKLRTVMPLRDSQAGILPAHLADDPSITKLKEQLNDSIAACRAHQSQNAFLAQEISRREKENLAYLEQKEQTIKRLAREIAMMKSMLLELASKQDPASPEKIVDAIPPLLVDVPLEDLKTQIEVVKKDFFFALLHSIKLQAAMLQAPLNIDATRLYGKIITQGVPYPRWSEWINFQINRHASTSTVSYVSPIISTFRN